eukprot:6491409-Amphidinium_carterae.2
MSRLQLGVLRDDLSRPARIASASMLQPPSPTLWWFPLDTGNACTMTGTSCTDFGKSPEWSASPFASLGSSPRSLSLPLAPRTCACGSWPLTLNPLARFAVRHRSTTVLALAEASSAAY